MESLKSTAEGRQRNELIELCLLEPNDTAHIQPCASSHIHFTVLIDVSAQPHKNDIPSHSFFSIIYDLQFSQKMTYIRSVFVFQRRPSAATSRRVQKRGT